MKLFKHMSKKDRRSLLAGLAALLFILFLTIVVFPMQSRESFYKNQIARKKAVASDISLMSLRYKQLKESFEKLKSSSKEGSADFTLFSFLDGVAKDTELKNNIKGMKPSIQSGDDYIESTVVVELEDVGMKALFEYLHAIESSPHNLRIKKADFKPKYSDPAKISATLIISSIKLNK